MRHIQRTQGVNVAWLHDLFTKGLFTMMYTSSESQCADLFTKAFKEGHRWDEAVSKIGVSPKDGPVRPPPPLGRRPEKPGKAKPKKKAKAKAKAQTVLKAKVEDLEGEGATSAPSGS